MTKHLTAITRAGCALALAAALAGCAQPVLKKPGIDALVGVPAVRSAPDFKAFLAQAGQADKSLAPGIAAYNAGRSLSGDELVNVSRLLGVYTRLRYQREDRKSVV